MLVVPIIVGAVGLILGVLGVIFAARAYSKQGTVRSALDTIKILQAQVDAQGTEINTFKTENASLRTEVGVLRDLVTQATPVRDLAEAAQTRHAEIMNALSRLEGAHTQ